MRYLAAHKNIEVFCCFLRRCQQVQAGDVAKNMFLYTGYNKSDVSVKKKRDGKLGLVSGVHNI